MSTTAVITSSTDLDAAFEAWQHACRRGKPNRFMLHKRYLELLHAAAAEVAR